MDLVKFGEMQAPEPDVEELKRHYETLKAELAVASDEAARSAVISSWDEIRKGVQTWVSLTHVHFAQDTQNEAYREAQNRADELGPRLEELDVAFKRLLLESPERTAMEQRFGSHAFHLWQADRDAFDPSIVDASVAEKKLDSKYTEL